MPSNLASVCSVARRRCREKIAKGEQSILAIPWHCPDLVGLGLLGFLGFREPLGFFKHPFFAPFLCQHQLGGLVAGLRVLGLNTLPRIRKQAGKAEARFVPPTSGLTTTSPEARGRYYVGILFIPFFLTTPS